MLTLLGTLIGFATSALPGVLRLIREQREHTQELERMRLSAELQEKLGTQKLEAAALETDAAATRALYRHDAAISQRASTWVINLVCSVRPVVTYGMLLVLAGQAILVATNVMDQARFEAIWNGPVGAIAGAVMAYWFGNRSFEKAGANTL